MRRRRVSAHSTVEIEDARADDSVAVARHEGDGGAGELDEQEGLIEDGCGERGGSEERVHCCVCAGGWCGAWVRLMGCWKMGNWEGQTIHEIGEVDKVVAVLGETVGEETTVVGFPAEDVRDHDDDGFCGIGGRGNVGV